MARWEKRLRAMIDDPSGHSYDDAASVLRQLDFEEPRKRKGSHRFWRHRDTGTRIGLLQDGKASMPLEYIKDMLDILRERGLMPSHIERNP